MPWVGAELPPYPGEHGLGPLTAATTPSFPESRVKSQPMSHEALARSLSFSGLCDPYFHVGVPRLTLPSL